MDGLTMLCLAIITLVQVLNAKHTTKLKRDLDLTVEVVDGLQKTFILFFHTADDNDDDGGDAEMCDCVDFEHGVGGDGECEKCYGSGWINK